jgi:iron complex transport system substrate-binding protein
MAQPPRIVSLVPSGTEVLFALGLDAQIVGVSHACDWPPAARRLPRLTRSRIDDDQRGYAIDVQVRTLLTAGEPLYAVDLELLAELAPDLIVTQAQCDVCAVRYDDVVRWVANEPRLQSSRILGLNPRRLDEALGDVGRVAEAAGVADAGRALEASLRRRIDAVAKRVRRLDYPRPVVACLEWLEPPMLAGNWGPELVDLAGGVQPLTLPGAHSVYVDWPDVFATDPQVLVVCPCGFDLLRSADAAGALARLPGWRNLSAVRSGRAYALDGNAYFNRPGPRLVDTLELLAHLIHPETYGAPPHARWQAVRY